MKSFQLFLSIISLVISFLPVCCVVYPELAEKGQKAPRSERCGDCHRDIYNEWLNSPHAHSFTNGAFKEETSDYQFTFCIGCHAPETIFTDTKVEPRRVNQSEGVNCISCHLNDCKLSGPTPAHGPHPITEKNPFFRTSDLCGKCHIGTFKEWQESDVTEGKKTCQECHMPAIKRKLIQDDPWQKIYPKRAGKQHLFSFQSLISGNEDLLQLSFIKVIRLVDDKIEGVLELENTGVPHRIPTGNYGYREVVVTIELQDEAGRIENFKTESLFVETKTALKYKAKRCIPFCFTMSKDSKMLKAKVTRTSFHKETNILLAETTYAGL